MRSALSLATLLALATACAGAPPPPPSAPESKPEPRHTMSPAPGESHFAEITQLTFGGENAEAYWSFSGKSLIYQARKPGEACDRIYRMDLTEPLSHPVQVSSGKGATTCSYFLPGDRQIIYASTHLGSDACPPRPDRSRGYVWALYKDYDIFRANADGSALVRLTDTPGYDAEGTVCKKDGSIIFTSVRDGDLDLYRMDSDGKNVRRLTHTPGYDGGAFFSPDCSKIVWRASRPKTGPELEEYQRLLAANLVRPTKLEIYIANADGSDPVQLTYLDAASFAPSWFPSGKRIIFASNYGDPKGREFDLWAIDTDGTRLERITRAPGFDGFPLFSPDGTTLAFSSNRATPPGRHDGRGEPPATASSSTVPRSPGSPATVMTTNVFLARWTDGVASSSPLSSADRTQADIVYLADPAREGRGVGTKGLEDAASYIEGRFKDLGLEPAGDDLARRAANQGEHRAEIAESPRDRNGQKYMQAFAATTSIAAGPQNALYLDGTLVQRTAWVPLGYSARGTVEGSLVLAGYGIDAPELGADDYKGIDVRNKIVLVRRFVPGTEPFKDPKAERRYGDIRHKAWVAREKGAKALVVVDWPVLPKPGQRGSRMVEEARLPALRAEGYGDAGLPVVAVKREAVQKLMRRLERRNAARAKIQIDIEPKETETWNIVARLRSGAPADRRLPGIVVLGAHYDHLGYGGPASLAPDRHEPHVGADDNASGTAALLEAARLLFERRAELRRDVLFIAFSGEEMGVLGSTHFTRRLSGGVAMKEVVAMINMDMVGRMRRNHLDALGSDSADEWTELVRSACDSARVECATSGDGYGPSDQTPFYAAGVPVLHLFTGAHSDYHKPSDVAAAINAAGTGQVAAIASKLVELVSTREQRLTYRAAPAPLPRGDLRSFNAALGTIPDYAGPPDHRPGVLLAGVRPGGGADKGGLRRGDILIRLGKHPIRSVEDLMYVLNASKPGETVTAVVFREGQEVPLEVTFQESQRR